jgi:hypothetical protein
MERAMNVDDRLRDEVEALQANLQRIDVTARLEELNERVRRLQGPSALPNVKAKLLPALTYL